MAIARMRQIDASVTRWYHCMARCVRRAQLPDEGTFDRKASIETRIEELAQISSNDPAETRPGIPPPPPKPAVFD
jgi:hypothetical protein